MRRGRCAAPSPCPPPGGLGSWSRKARLPRKLPQRRGGQDSRGLCRVTVGLVTGCALPRACQEQSVLPTVLGRAGQERGRERAARHTGRGRGRASGALPGQARRGARRRGQEGRGGTSAGARVCRQGSRGPRPGVQDAASSCSAPAAAREPTWVPAVLPEHVGLHAVLQAKSDSSWTPDTCSLGEPHPAGASWHGCRGCSTPRILAQHPGERGQPCEAPGPGPGQRKMP